MAVAHFPLDRLATALRADGVSVNILSGAQGRSARMFSSVGYSGHGCQAMVQHHTASSGDNPSGDINYILQGKGTGYVISNAYTARSGVVTLIASGPTYTEGSGGPYGIIPENTANRVCFSNEIGNPGTGRAYTDVQARAAMYLAYHVCTIAADVWNWPDDPYGKYRLFSHFEWTTRKIDPWGPSPWSGNSKWNMDAHRADVKACAPAAPDPTPPPEPPTTSPQEDDDEMRLYVAADSAGAIWVGNGITRRRLKNNDEYTQLVFRSDAGCGPKTYWAVGSAGQVTSKNKGKIKDAERVAYYNGGMESLGQQED
jgi:hypothetical protein